MAHSRIIDELISRDPARVRADLEAIQKEKAALLAEETLLNQVLALQAMRDGKQGDAPVAADAEAVRQANGAPARGISTAVLDIVRSAAPVWLSYDAVYERLRERNIKATRNAMRVALRRWVERGELEINPNGEFRAVTPLIQRLIAEGGNS